MIETAAGGVVMVLEGSLTGAEWLGPEPPPPAPAANSLPDMGPDEGTSSSARHWLDSCHEAELERILYEEETSLTPGLQGGMREAWEQGNAAEEMPAKSLKPSGGGVKSALRQPGARYPARQGGLGWCVCTPHLEPCTTGCKHKAPLVG